MKLSHSPRKAHEHILLLKVGCDFRKKGCIISIEVSMMTYDAFCVTLFYYLKT